VKYTEHFARAASTLRGAASCRRVPKASMARAGAPCKKVSSFRPSRIYDSEIERYGCYCILVHYYCVYSCTLYAGRRVLEATCANSHQNMKNKASLERSNSVQPVTKTFR
jgi:hypothetical protein